MRSRYSATLNIAGATGIEKIILEHLVETVPRVIIAYGNNNRAQDVAAKIHEKYLAYCLEVSELISVIPGEQTELLNKLLNSATILGMYYADLNALIRGKPNELLVCALVEGGARGGKASGEARRKLAAERWEAPALELAKMKRADAPHISQDDLAADIQAAWKSEAIPSFASLRRFLRRAQADGRLPKRIPRGVAKGVR